ncbi:MAG TPA: hypothetical protein VGK91_09225 [Candidatus Udaeobacter sp.]
MSREANDERLAHTMALVLAALKLSVVFGRNTRQEDTPSRVVWRGSRLASFGVVVGIETF